MKNNTRPAFSISDYSQTIGNTKVSRHSKLCKMPKYINCVLLFVLSMYGGQTWNQSSGCFNQEKWRFSCLGFLNFPGREILVIITES